MRTLLSIAILCAAPACVYDLDRPKPDAPQDGAPDRPFDGPGSDSSPDAPALDASRKDAPAKPPDTSKPLDKAPLLPDKPKAPAPERKADAGCTWGQCWSPSYGCTPGHFERTCGSIGSCADCRKTTEECRNLGPGWTCMPCTGCVQAPPGGSPYCVPRGWVNAPNCGANGGACDNCNNYSGDARCDKDAGVCANIDASKRP